MAPGWWSEALRPTLISWLVLTAVDERRAFLRPLTQLPGPDAYQYAERYDYLGG